MSACTRARLGVCRMPAGVSRLEHGQGAERQAGVGDQVPGGACAAGRQRGSGRHLSLSTYSTRLAKVGVLEPGGTVGSSL